MSTLRHGHRCGPGVVVVSMLLALTAPLALTAMPAAAADHTPAAAPEASPLAAVVHLSGGPSPGFPATAAEVRAATFDILSALVGAHGRFLADRAVTEELVRRHRVRTGGSLTAAFLGDVREQTRASTLLAVELLAEGGRLAVTVREIDAASGSLTALGQAETVPTAATWRAALTEALRLAYQTPTAAVPGAAPLLILPARTIGLDGQVSRTTTGCVLAEALADGRWSVLDPGLVAGAAAAAGHDLRFLDRDGRALLGEHCGVTWAIVPEIVSFDLANAGVSDRAALEPDQDYRVQRAVTLTLTLQLLDLRTGIVRSAISTLIPGEARVGWFGHVRQSSELELIQAAARRLWARFQPVLEEQTS